MPNELATKILKILDDITTPIVAKSAITVHCKHLNITMDTVTPSHIDQLCEKIVSGFSSFGIDPTKLNNTINKIKALK